MMQEVEEHHAKVVIQYADEILEWVKRIVGGEESDGEDSIDSLEGQE